MFRADYIENSWRYTLSYDFKVIRIYLDGNISNSVRDSIGQTPCSVNIILLYIIVIKLLHQIARSESHAVCRWRCCWRGCIHVVARPCVVGHTWSETLSPTRSSWSTRGQLAALCQSPMLAVTAQHCSPKRQSQTHTHRQTQRLIYTSWPQTHDAYHRQNECKQQKHTTVIPPAPDKPTVEPLCRVSMRPKHWTILTQLNAGTDTKPQHCSTQYCTSLQFLVVGPKQEVLT